MDGAWGADQVQDNPYGSQWLNPLWHGIPWELPQTLTFNGVVERGHFYEL